MSQPHVIRLIAGELRLHWDTTEFILLTATPFVVFDSKNFCGIHHLNLSSTRFYVFFLRLWLGGNPASYPGNIKPMGDTVKDSTGHVPGFQIRSRNSLYSSRGQNLIGALFLDIFWQKVKFYFIILLI